MNAPELLTTIEAAKLLRVGQQTLENWRSSGVGPRFVKIGRMVRYRLADLQSWIDANTVAP